MYVAVNARVYYTLVLYSINVFKLVSISEGYIVRRYLVCVMCVFALYVYSAWCMCTHSVCVLWLVHVWV